MNKPYLVTVASKTPGVERFAASLKHIENQVDHISIQFQPPIEQFRPYKVHDTAYCGNLKRFEYIPALDDNRFVIFSDTDDVIFQRPLPDLERMNYEVYLGNENVKHKDSFWKGFIERNPYFEPCSNQTVYNAGLFAMRGRVFKQLQKFMKDNIQFVVDLADHGSCDQMLFNLFFLKNPYFDIYKGPDIFCPLYNNIELRIIKTRKGLFYLNDGHVPVAVHGNGNTKGILEDGRKMNKFTKKNE